MSKQSKEFLESLYKEPVLDVAAINQDLYKKVPMLKTVKVKIGLKKLSG